MVVLASRYSSTGRTAGDRGVRGVAGRVTDDVFALGAVGPDPVPLRRRVLLRKLAGLVGGSRNRPLRTAFGPAVLATWITTSPEIAQSRYTPPLNDEIVSVARTAPVAALLIWICSAPTRVVPIEEIQLQVVRPAVDKVHVDRETRRGVPAAAIRPVPPGTWRPRVGRAGRPGVAGLAAGCDGGVGGEVGRVADDLVALGAVGPDPVPFRRRVLLEERGRLGLAGGSKNRPLRTALGPPSW